MTKVLIVEDQKLAAESMAGYVNNNEHYVLAGILTNAAMAELFCSGNKVDLILMDVCTEHDESGFVATASIKKHFPGIKVIIVTSMVECSFIDKAHSVKADSFWYKDASKEELISIMDRTMAGESVYPEKTPEVELGFITSYKLTDAELRVLRLLVNGLSYEEIAEKLGIKATTVITHTNNMLSKTGYKNKLRLCVAVSAKKLIIPEIE